MKTYSYNPVPEIFTLKLKELHKDFNVEIIKLYRYFESNKGWNIEIKGSMSDIIELENACNKEIWRESWTTAYVPDKSKLTKNLLK